MSAERFVPPEAQEAAKEMKKRQEIRDLVVGWKEMLADPDLPEEQRAEIEEQILWAEEGLAEAEATGVTIYKE